MLFPALLNSALAKSEKVWKAKPRCSTWNIFGVVQLLREITSRRGVACTAAVQFLSSLVFVCHAALALRYNFTLRQFSLFDQVWKPCFDPRVRRSQLSP